MHERIAVIEIGFVAVDWMPFADFVYIVVGFDSAVKVVLNPLLNIDVVYLEQIVGSDEIAVDLAFVVVFPIEFAQRLCIDFAVMAVLNPLLNIDHVLVGSLGNLLYGTTVAFEIGFAVAVVAAAVAD